MYAHVGGYLQLYVLGALDPSRFQLQILHEYDSNWCAVPPNNLTAL